jgi:hypothetical protein
MIAFSGRRVVHSSRVVSLQKRDSGFAESAVFWRPIAGSPALAVHWHTLWRGGHIAENFRARNLSPPGRSALMPAAPCLRHRRYFRWLCMARGPVVVTAGCADTPRRRSFWCGLPRCRACSPKRPVCQRSHARTFASVLPRVITDSSCGPLFADCTDDCTGRGANRRPRKRSTPLRHRPMSNSKNSSSVRPVP